MKLEELLAKGSSSSPQHEDEDDDEKGGTSELEAKSSKPTNTIDEGDGEGVENDNGEDYEEKGKKKGTRKKRSLNWEEAERGLLLEVIKTKVAFVENRSVDAKSIKAKRLAWSQITKQFNSMNFRHRLLEQIQVQWRSMKNTAKREYQQKHPKGDALEGMRIIEFMEELHKDPVNSRSQTRGAPNGGVGGGGLKKEILDIDEDEDMPLAAHLPNATNASEDTLQTSTIAIPSPPPSTAGGDGDSQPECVKPPGPPTPNRRKRAKLANKLASANDIATVVIESEKDKPVAVFSTSDTPMRSKRRQRNHSQAQSVMSDDMNEATSNMATTMSSAQTDTISIANMEQKYKQELFKLLKQARLAEIDYARREHEQKLRFEQMEQDLKLHHMREEHDLRLRQQRREHEARLRVYSIPGFGRLNGNGNPEDTLPPTTTFSGRCNAKTNQSDYNILHTPPPQPSTSGEDETLGLNAGYN
ncbi:uncharacterized protein [Drosophila tropicalis]|uniref:uncharacterized protein n=1 Tax=Drosophila tropicalis TaxID=46794 RepID=UPI0035ABB33B